MNEPTLQEIARARAAALFAQVPLAPAPVPVLALPGVDTTLEHGAGTVKIPWRPGIAAAGGGTPPGCLTCGAPVPFGRARCDPCADAAWRALQNTGRLGPRVTAPPAPARLPGAGPGPAASNDNDQADDEVVL